MDLSYDRSTPRQVEPAVRQAADEPEVDGDLNELQVADYVVFILALETFMGWLQETGLPPDETLQRGLTLAKLAERQNLEAIGVFIKSNLTSKASIALLEAALRPAPTAKGIAMRATKLRTVLSKGGTATTKAVFGTSTKAKRQVQEAIDASMIDDPDAALNKFAALTLKNKKLEKWIDEASAVCVTPGTAPINPIQEAARGATDASAELLKSQVQQDVKSGTDQAVAGRDQQAATLTKVQAEATAAAKKAMEQAGEVDQPLTKAEVIGVATAAATAVSSDPDKPQNVPPALQRLDPEQRAAAMTGGKVRVSAGAGSGKSTTLLARVQYLIDNGAVPNRMIVMSFNKKAADELAIKMAGKIGSDRVSTTKNPQPNGARVGTMHAVFLKFINENGTPAQKAMFAKVNGRGGIVKAEKIFSSVKEVWDECFRDIDKYPPGDPNGRERELPQSELWKMPPKSKRMMAYLNLFQGQGWSYQQAAEWTQTQGGAPEAEQALKFFEVYEGLKGSLGASWRPNLCGPRPSPAFNKFVQNNRPNKPQAGDFNDMLAAFHNILKTQPLVRAKVQSLFDHVMVDECQDLNPLQFEILQMMTEHVETDDPKKSFWMVGDDKQCPSAETEIDTPSGKVLAKNLKTGDMVLAYRNGAVVPQKVTVTPSEWTWGYRVTTASGRSLHMSPNHKIWATPPVLQEGEVAVYLMYREDMGFRVGVTKKGQGGSGYLGSFAGRAFQEKAERMWILSICKDREEALLEELSVALKHGVPMSVFNGKHRGLNQERLDEVFKRFGSNGSKLLEDRGLSFDLPHWMSGGYSKHGRERRVVHMRAHTATRAGSLVTFEWTPAPGDGFTESLRSEAKVAENGRLRIRKASTSYRASLELALGLAHKTKAMLDRSLQTPEGPLPLVTAASLHVGMKVPVWDAASETLDLDTIVSVVREDGVFVGLDVDDASNFFGGGILSHNSIYQFRGADPNNFIQLDQMGFKDRQITTNYRCAPEFVDAANTLIAKNENQIPMEAKAAPNRARGEASLLVKKTDDDVQAAREFGKKIRVAVAAGEPLSNFAVLARTNAELAVYQQMCATLGLRYVQKKATSVFASQESETFRSFTSSVAATSPAQVQDQFCQTLMSAGLLKPKLDADRGENQKKAHTMMKGVLREYCSRNRKDLNTFDPIVEARNNPSFIAFVLSKYGTPDFGARKDAAKAGPLLEGIMQLREFMKDPDFTSEDLFQGVLALPVIELLPPDQSSTGGWEEVTRSFGESTEKRMAFRATQEDADEDPELADEKPSLGTLDFVYDMLQPSDVDPDYNPQDPKAFFDRFEGLAAKGAELRIDPDVWDKKQEDEGVPLAQRTPPPGVYLGTVHSTKGAEWEDVTLLMPKGKFPMERVPPKPKPNVVPENDFVDAQTKMESERRLGYVGLTRAKKTMTVLCPGGFSPFVGEAGLKSGQNVPQPATSIPGEVLATPTDVLLAEGSVEEPTAFDDAELTEMFDVEDAAIDTIMKQAGLFVSRQKKAVAESQGYSYERSVK